MCRNNKRPLIVLKFFKEQAVKQFPVVCVKPQNRLCIVVGRSIVVPDREVIETTLEIEVLSIGHLQLDVARRIGVDARRASVAPDLSILEVEQVALVELHVDEIDLDRIHIVGLRPYEGDVARVGALKLLGDQQALLVSDLQRHGALQVVSTHRESELGDVHQVDGQSIVADDVVVAQVTLLAIDHLGILEVDDDAILALAIDDEVGDRVGARVVVLRKLYGANRRNDFVVGSDGLHRAAVGDGEGCIRLSGTSRLDR